MAKNPAARFASTQQIADALNAILASLSSPSSVGMTTPSNDSEVATSAPPVAPVQSIGTAENKTTGSASAPPSGLPETKSGESKSGESKSAGSKSGETKRSGSKRKSKTKRRSKKPAGLDQADTQQGATTPPSPPSVASTDSASTAGVQPSKPPTPVVAPPITPTTTSDKQRSDLGQASTTVSAGDGAHSGATAPSQSKTTLSQPNTTAAAPAIVTARPDSIPPEPPPVADADGKPSEQKSEQKQSPLRRRKRKKSKAPLILGALSVPVLAMLIMVIVGGPLSPAPKPKKKRPPIPAVVPAVGSATRTPTQVPTDTPPAVVTNSGSAGDAPGGYRLVNEGEFLWVPPYPADTKPASLDLLPPGPAVIVAARLNKVITDTTGRDVVASLSPELAGLIKQAADRARIKVQEIDRCAAALHAGENGWPQVSLVIELLEPRSAKELSDMWQASAARTADGATIYAGEEPDGDAYFLGDSQQGALAPDAMVKRFAIGSIEMMKEVAANEGGGIPLPRALQKLWDKSSDQADLTVLITPNFLFADGRAMLQSVAPELVDPLKKVLISDFAGVMISATAHEGTVYSEVRATPSGGVTAVSLMKKLSDAIGQWPSWAQDFSVDATPDRSWKLLANRLPQMMRFFADHSRFSVEDDVAVANNYLPGNAASQISLATLLAMNTKPGVAVAAIAPTPEKPLTVNEMLDRTMSVSFEQESLEFAINVIVDEFKQSLPAGSTMPPVRMIGSDLEKMGITQNQQIRDFNKQEVPLRSVLTDLVRGANPDKTATGPDDPKQALVWVVTEKAGGGTEILVTTRQAADGNYDLPPEFKIKP
ncbi:MAG: hypothetical protein HKN47_04025 [Pirellulaceae bacterium]|nr:hypothetical protein [Pirellulaceae bacterium]